MQSEIVTCALLAPSRLVVNWPMHSGYDLGVAATAGILGFDLDLPPLTSPGSSAVLRAMEAAENVHRAYYWHEAGGPLPRRAVRERFTEMRSRTEKIRKAVSAGDAALLELRRHGLVLLVTTRPETFVPLPPGMVKPHPFSAVVGASRLA
ncbi:MAG TPA: hypothetical protein VN691_03290 [Steroidobacteraceae bacterium]|nr:hypothetical protein [Steroidobacteraceae bacterium]